MIGDQEVPELMANRKAAPRLVHATFHQDNPAAPIAVGDQPALEALGIKVSYLIDLKLQSKILDR